LEAHLRHVYLTIMLVVVVSSHPNDLLVHFISYLEVHIVTPTKLITRIATTVITAGGELLDPKIRPLLRGSDRPCSQVHVSALLPCSCSIHQRAAKPHTAAPAHSLHATCLEATNYRRMSLCAFLESW
jgi:hypothetical protein